MPIVVNVDVMLARRKMTSAELADKIGLSAVNLSILKTGKAKGVRFSTLDALWNVSMEICLSSGKTPSEHH